MRRMVVSTQAASMRASETRRVDIDKEDGGQDHAGDYDSE